jgi:endonuclease/exonuclease/phosphatase family metal-dependent hydrolase
MPFYKNINSKTEDGKRTLNKLLALRENLKDSLPKRTLEDTVLLASWNIREFDNEKYGWRLDEAYQYIAEIISHFDIVSIQEVRSVKSLEKLCSVLGSYWKYIVTDVTAGRRGNLERLAYVYDSRKIRFGGLAAELVLPPVKGSKDESEPAIQIARTPFMCGFKSGWSNFMIVSVHIRYGKSDPHFPPRIAEIKNVCKFLGERIKDDSTWTKNVIILGDFNIFDSSDPIMDTFTDAGFEIPGPIQSVKTNVSKKTKNYDQIAINSNMNRFEFTGNAGVFDFYKTVFKPDEHEIYLKYFKDCGSKNLERYYRNYWRTFQMSDHLPIWVEMKVNFSDEYLTKKLSW